MPRLLPLVVNQDEVGARRAVIGLAAALSNAEPISISGLTSDEVLHRVTGGHSQT